MRVAHTRRPTGRTTEPFVSNDPACVTFLLTSTDRPAKIQFSECIRTRQLDAALLNVH